MRKLIIILFIGTTIPRLIAQEDIKGIWNIGEENTKVEIYEKEGAIWGKIISSDNKDLKTGIDILRDFTFKKDKWVGKMYAIRKKKEVNAEFVKNGDNLNIQIHVGFITKNLEWKKEE